LLTLRCYVFRRFGGEVVEKTICIFLGELTQCDANVNIKHSLKLTEHIGYEWIEWNPPFTHMQTQTVRPLLEAAQRHFAGETGAAQGDEGEKEVKTGEKEVSQLGGEDDEDVEDEEEGDDEAELVGDGQLNAPLPSGEQPAASPAKKASKARANRKTRRKRNVLMQAGYALLDKEKDGSGMSF
jgi:hypothetical protein